MFDEEGENRISEIGEPAIEPLDYILMNDEKQELRLTAAKILGKMKSSDAVKSLIDALGDEDFEVAWAASDALIGLGSFCVDVLLDAIKNEDSSETRARMVRPLGDIIDSRVNSALIDILKNDTDDGIRRKVTTRLGQLKEKAAVKPILEYIEESNLSGMDVDFAIIALGEIGDPSVTERLVGVLKLNESDHFWLNSRKAAVDALENLGWKPEENSTDMAYCIMAKGGDHKRIIDQLIPMGKNAIEPLTKLRDYLATLEPGDTSHGGLTEYQVYGYNHESLLHRLNEYLGD